MTLLGGGLRCTECCLVAVTLLSVQVEEFGKSVDIWCIYKKHLATYFCTSL